MPGETSLDRKAAELRNLRIDEVSAVDRPASGLLGHIILKSADQEETAKAHRIMALEDARDLLAKNLMQTKGIDRKTAEAFLDNSTRRRIAKRKATAADVTQKLPRHPRSGRFVPKPSTPTGKGPEPFTAGVPQKSGLGFFTLNQNSGKAPVRRGA